MTERKGLLLLILKFMLGVPVAVGLHRQSVQRHTHTMKLRHIVSQNVQRFPSLASTACRWPLA